MPEQVSFGSKQNLCEDGFFWNLHFVITLCNCSTYRIFTWSHYERKHNCQQSLLTLLLCLLQQDEKDGEGSANDSAPGSNTPGPKSTVATPEGSVSSPLDEKKVGIVIMISVWLLLVGFPSLFLVVYVIVLLNARTIRVLCCVPCVVVTLHWILFVYLFQNDGKSAVVPKLPPFRAADRYFFSNVVIQTNFMRN